MCNMVVKGFRFLVAAAFCMSILGCGGTKEAVTDLSRLEGKVFAVPAGTVADELVLSRLPNAEFKYYDSVLDACMAVKEGKADAAAYDEPILKNIAAKNPGLRVLPQMITTDNYGFAVKLGDRELKSAIDDVIGELKSSGAYDEMLSRWLPDEGDPAPMPEIQTAGDESLRFGTSAITEPFSFIDGSQRIVGLDIEIASLVAQKLGKRLEIVNMDFGEMIPALAAGKVDMIGACITMTEERAEKVLFSVPYYAGGIAAVVRE
jgi:polar amino acid transport system substrate-binding protein